MYTRGIPTKSRRKKLGTPLQTKLIQSSKTKAHGFEESRIRRSFPTDYCGLMKFLPTNLPSSLYKGIVAGGDDSSVKKKENPGPGKVRNQR